MIPTTLSQALVSLLLLVGDEPPAAQTYYEAPIGVDRGGPSGPMIPRTELFLPSANSDIDRSTKKLMNASRIGNDQKLLGMARAYGYECDPAVPTRCGQKFARMILWFSPKATANIKLIFEQPWPRFHLLGKYGGAYWVGNGDAIWPGWYYTNPPVAQVWNDLHTSENNLFMGFALPWPNDIDSGQVMEVLIDTVQGWPNKRNRFWVIAE